MGQSNSERQAAYRARRRQTGLIEITQWVNPQQREAIQAILQGKTQQSVADDPAELQLLTTDLQNQQRLVKSLRHDLDFAHSQINALREQLAAAQRQATGKPSRGLKVVELTNRRQVIADGMRVGWGSQERDPGQLKEQADLSRKFSTEIKAVRTRLLTFIGVATGQKSVERKGTWGAMSFPSRILSESESDLLLGACTLLGHIEGDVERAGSDTLKLHKQRAAELQAMRAQALAMADAALFAGLDRRGEALFVAAANGDRRAPFSEWKDLLDILAGKGDRWSEPASVLFRREMTEHKGRLISQLVSKLKAGDAAAAEAHLAEVIRRFRHQDTEEKYGDLASRLTALLVAEQIESAARPGKRQA